MPDAGTSPGDVEMLGRLYGADRKTVRSLIDLIRATRTRRWAAGYRDMLPDIVGRSIDLEGYACRIRYYMFESKARSAGADRRYWLGHRRLPGSTSFWTKRPCAVPSQSPPP